ncbi:MAG: IS3 family transposase, partial [Candidatus Borkfalkiaceae bacterium]|nr:IS3 family transposase [Christensenellaceae bacterium]
MTELRRKYPFEKLLKFLSVPRSTYYYYLKQSKKADKYCFEKQEISEIFETNKARYGYRRILAVLRQKGYIINHKTVLRLMNELGLQAKQRKSKYKSYKGEVGKIADNLLKRNFTADKPFEKLTTDVTGFSVCNEKVYLSPIMDLYNREIISYSISKSPNFDQTREMLQGLFEKLPQDATPLLHSDQGWQYQMRAFQRILAEHNITQSMSRKGNCLDNSSMENFFGRL